LTRHELKDQVQHDQFTDTVSSALNYAALHRQQVTRWAIIAVVVLAAVGAIWGYESYQDSQRQLDLEAALEIADTPVGAANADPSIKSFPTQDAKIKASMKALSGVVAKDGGTRQGLTAQYYLGTLKAQNGDEHGAEADLNSVANSRTECAPLAKIALAQLYAGEKKTSQAQGLLRDLINKPSDLISKAQATIFLAHLEETTNPQESRKLLNSLKTEKPDPAVSHAVEQMSAQITK
jgi:predicted negative regulator of RcsB-dependent stress response